jgi:hypothetical protein
MSGHRGGRPVKSPAVAPGLLRTGVACLVISCLQGGPAASAQEKADAAGDRLDKLAAEVSGLREEFQARRAPPPRVPTWLPLWLPEVATLVGVFAFGAVVGWLAHHTFRRTAAPDARWLGGMVGGMLGVIAGGALTSLLEPREWLFGTYCVGLGLAFFTRAAVLRSAGGEPAPKGAGP